MTRLDIDDAALVGEPSAAYAMLVSKAKSVLIEATRRRASVLPGLSEHLQDNVLVVVGGTTRSALGWFQCASWHHDGRPVDEIFVNADFRQVRQDHDVAEEVLDTLLHEACHAWNAANRIKDCSNRGRYHNRRFAEVALQLGLLVDRDARFGHTTVGLQPTCRDEFADLLFDLRDALTIVRRPRHISRVPSETTESAGTPEPSVSEQGDRPSYVFASCRCRTARGGEVTFRMAHGSWRDDIAITCSACGSAFRPRVSTNSG